MAASCESSIPGMTVSSGTLIVGEVEAVGPFHLSSMKTLDHHTHQHPLKIPIHRRIMTVFAHDMKHDAPASLVNSIESDAELWPCRENP